MLRQLSSIDGLTGIANRRHLDEVLDLEWRRALRVAGPVSLIMIDIDNFKEFNDAHGHQRGDDFLKSIATLLQTRAPSPGDLVARTGGVRRRSAGHGRRGRPRLREPASARRSQA